ncbi:MAG: ABC transporter permease [Caldicoprobacterales bacterium]|jgi:peptide/nickel transport system permease protein
MEMKGKRLINISKVIGKYLFRVMTLLLATSIVAFVLVSLSPIDPVQQYVMGAGAVSMEQRETISEYWGLNAPPTERYLNWLSAILRGDMGVSLLYRQPVARIISERFINTFALMMTSWILSGIIGFVLGCVMGICQGKWVDSIIKRICLVLCSVPTFWLGLVFLLIFSVWLGWFPIGFSSPIGIADTDVSIWQRLYHLVLPALTLSFISFANVALHTRQKLIDVLESDYVLFARARGNDTWTIMKRHGFRNILLPAITLQFASFAELFGGSVLAENVFSYPGLGSAVSAAGLNSDVPLLLGITLFSTLFVFLGNFIANIIYGVVDPRIGEERPHGQAIGD